MDEVIQAVLACTHRDDSGAWIYSEDLEWLVKLYGDAVYYVDFKPV